MANFPRTRESRMIRSYERYIRARPEPVRSARMVRGLWRLGNADSVRGGLRIDSEDGCQWPARRLWRGPDCGRIAIPNALSGAADEGYRRDGGQPGHARGGFEFDGCRRRGADDGAVVDRLGCDRAGPAGGEL